MNFITSDTSPATDLSSTSLPTCYIMKVKTCPNLWISSQVSLQKQLASNMGPQRWSAEINRVIIAGVSLTLNLIIWYMTYPLAIIMIYMYLMNNTQIWYNVIGFGLHQLIFLWKLVHYCCLCYIHIIAVTEVEFKKSSSENHAESNMTCSNSLSGRQEDGNTNLYTYLSLWYHTWDIILHLK